MTPLMLAALKGRKDVVQLLLDRGASATAVTPEGYDAFYLAAEGGQSTEVMQLLLSACGCVERRAVNDVTPIWIAASEGKYDAVKFIVENGGALDAQTCTGRSALHICAERGHVDVARYLISVRADCDLVNTNGSTLR